MMASLLVREKKFLELNEGLNKMTMESIRRPNFQTYTKQKGRKLSSETKKTNTKLPLDQCDDVQQQITVEVHENSIGRIGKLSKPEPIKNISESSPINRTHRKPHEEEKLKRNVTTSNPINNDVSTRFLKKKIQILEEGRDRLAQEMKQQKEIITQTLSRNKQLEQQFDQAVSKNNLLIEQLRKSEVLLEQSNVLNKERNLENLRLQQELQESRSIQVNLKQTIATLEKRLSRAHELIEASKTTLKDLKLSENEHLKTKRQNIEKMLTQINGLKKQRTTLLNAIKKQFLLMHNLKRQNVCMEQAFLHNISEKDFIKVLSWKKIV